MKKPKVYVVAKGYHDWSAAETHGELVFLSTEPFGRTSVSNMMRTFEPVLEESEPEDFIIISGLSVMCSLACSLFVLKHRRLNLLLFDAATEKYIKRKVMFDQGDKELDGKDMDSYLSRVRESTESEKT
jgi:hypothetical protein